MSKEPKSARVGLAVVLLLAFGGCAEPSDSPDSGVSTATTPAPAPGPAEQDGPRASSSPARLEHVEEVERPTFDSPTAAETIQIPAGSLHVGSLPGRPGRRPSVEADLPPVTLPAVDIDRLPYPNDPAQPARLAGTRNEAASLCEARGRRLCTELEWERACRGDGTDPFPTGETLDLTACVNDPFACASSVGVLDLGMRAPEWTASDAEERLARLERTAVVRGGRPESSLASHRCGSRHVTNPLGGGRALAFRCCGGETPATAYPDVGLRRMFRELDFDTARWREILAGVPELARFADDFDVFGETAALRALARGHATEAEMQWELTRGPFAWSPTAGEEAWIVAGRAGGASILAAIYPLPDGTFRHAASFVFAEEEAPVAVLRTRTTRNELQWTTCWSCGGENGVVRFDEDARIVIVQR